MREQQDKGMWMHTLSIYLRLGKKIFEEKYDG